MNWVIFDMTTERMVGLWPQYKDCVKFCLDNQEMSTDAWEIFPEYECYIPTYK